MKLVALDGNLVLTIPTTLLYRSETVFDEISHRHRSQTTVENCIGGHVNVLLDYKKT